VLGDRVPDAEEVAERGAHAGILLAVPEHLDDELAQVLLRVAAGREPDVLDTPRALDVGDDERLARGHDLEVVVAAGLVPARFAAGASVLHVSESAERAVRLPEVHVVCFPFFRGGSLSP
jgi:hypothetical protein